MYHQPALMAQKTTSLVTTANMSDVNWEKELPNWQDVEHTERGYPEEITLEIPKGPSQRHHSLPWKKLSQDPVSSLWWVWTSGCPQEKEAFVKTSRSPAPG